MSPRETVDGSRAGLAEFSVAHGPWIDLAPGHVTPAESGLALAASPPGREPSRPESESGPPPAAGGGTWTAPPGRLERGFFWDIHGGVAGPSVPARSAHASPRPSPWPGVRIPTSVRPTRPGCGCAWWIGGSWPGPSPWWSVARIRSLLGAERLQSEAAFPRVPLNPILAPTATPRSAYTPSAERPFPRATATLLTAPCPPKSPPTAFLLTTDTLLAFPRADQRGDGPTTSSASLGPPVGGWLDTPPRSWPTWWPDPWLRGPHPGGFTNKGAPGWVQRTSAASPHHWTPLTPQDGVASWNHSRGWPEAPSPSVLVAPPGAGPGGGGRVAGAGRPRRQISIPPLPGLRAGGHAVAPLRESRVRPARRRRPRTALREMGND